MLSELERKIVSAVQGDIPVIESPYREIARDIGVEEKELLRILEDLCRRNVIRRFGATLRHQKSGFKANAMVAWRVDPDEIDEAGRIMSESKQISHCYLRPTAPDWPYNLYTMIHAEDEASCRAAAKELSEKTGVQSYEILFSREELKKTSMQYFPSDDEDMD